MGPRKPTMKGFHQRRKEARKGKKIQKREEWNQTMVHAMAMQTSPPPGRETGVENQSVAIDWPAVLCSRGSLCAKPNQTLAFLPPPPSAAARARWLAFSPASFFRKLPCEAHHTHPQQSPAVRTQSTPPNLGRAGVLVSPSRTCCPASFGGLVNDDICG